MFKQGRLDPRLIFLSFHADDIPVLPSNSSEGALVHHSEEESCNAGDDVSGKSCLHQRKRFGRDTYAE